MKNNIFRVYQNRIKKALLVGENKIRLGYYRDDYDQKYIINILNITEKFALNYLSHKDYNLTKGFRYLPDYSDKLEEQLPSDKVYAFIWKDITAEQLDWYKTLLHKPIYVFDIRKHDDFTILKSFFHEEMTRFIDVLETIQNPENNFPIPFPFYKCMCLNCWTEGVSIPDLAFTMDARGDLIDGVRSKPLGYFNPETHSLFIMLYLQTFVILWEPLKPKTPKAKKGQHRLRDFLKRCSFCNDFYLSRRTMELNQDGEYLRGNYPCCNDPICISKNNSEKTKRAKQA